MAQSHPTMGAWIEIIQAQTEEITQWWSHPTMGAWIEINSQGATMSAVEKRRTPRWVRGLKYLYTPVPRR